MSHIATEDTFFNPADPHIEGTCPICQRPAKLQIGWVGLRCSKCGRAADPEEPQRVVNQRRLYLGKSVYDMAKIAGVGVKTIRKYESDWPSRRYWELTKRLVQEHNK